MVIDHQRRTHLHRQPKPDRHYDQPVGWSPLDMTVTVRHIPDMDRVVIPDPSAEVWPSPTSVLGDPLRDEA
jgi:hypothetical protein